MQGLGLWGTRLLQLLLLLLLLRFVLSGLALLLLSACLRLLLLLLRRLLCFVLHALLLLLQLWRRLLRLLLLLLLRLHGCHRDGGGRRGRLRPGDRPLLGQLRLEPETRKAALRCALLGAQQKKEQARWGGRRTSCSLPAAC